MQPRHTTPECDERCTPVTGFLRIFSLLAATLALTACDPPPVNRQAAAPLATVERVDIDRYLGRWYEIARYDHSFERGCTGVTATYSKNADGSIKVVNACRKGSLTGELDVAEGSAKPQNAENSKLAVTFFWPFAGDYWVIGLADDYSWALVGEPSGRYLWILSRTPQISPALRAELLGKLQAKGYNTNALIWVQQPAG
jgi:apolipoprotein D and lipocalin family protein